MAVNTQVALTVVLREGAVIANYTRGYISGRNHSEIADITNVIEDMIATRGMGHDGRRLEMSI